MSTTEDIKAKLELGAFLRSYLELQSAGKNFKARCPFHNEKTPSFMISPERQTWRCFGCSRSGDIFTFVMEYEHCEFYEALTLLAEKAGVEIQRQNAGEQRQLNTLFAINEAAGEFFIATLGASEAARAYLADRKLRPETWEEFSIGFAPADEDACIRHCIEKGFAMADIVRAGLAIPGRRGGHRDRFYNRLMFPIHNQFGRIVGFTGRILPSSAGTDPDTEPKYLNTPETPVFKKSKILYGFHRSKEHVRTSRTAFLVEGQMDFLMAWQDDIRNVIATSGTAVTPDHLTTLRRHADTLVVSFDNDNAGWNAAERVLAMAHQLDFATRAVLLPESSKDPAEIVAEKPGVLRTLVTDAPPALKLFFRRYPVTDNFAASKANIRTLLKTIAAFASPIDRGHWVRDLARSSGLAEEDLMAEMRTLHVASAGVAVAAPPQPQIDARARTRREKIAEHLITVAIAQNRTTELNALDIASCLPKGYQRILQALITGDADAQLRPHIALLMERAGLEEHGPLEDLVRELKKEYSQEQGSALLRAIRKAEQEEDYETVDRLMHKMSALKARVFHDAADVPR